MPAQRLKELNVYAVYGGDNRSPWIIFCFPGVKKLDSASCHRLKQALAPDIKIQTTSGLCYATFIAKPAQGINMSRAILQSHFFELARSQSWKVRGEDD